MDERAEFQLQTAINRVLLESGLDPTTIPDQVEALRGLERLGDRRARALLQQLKRLGRA